MKTHSFLEATAGTDPPQEADVYSTCSGNAQSSRTSEEHADHNSLRFVDVGYLTPPSSYWRTGWALGPTGFPRTTLYVSPLAGRTLTFAATLSTPLQHSTDS